MKSIVKVTAIGNSTLKPVKGQEKLVQKNHLHVIDVTLTVSMYLS